MSSSPSTDTPMTPKSRKRKSTKIEANETAEQSVTTTEDISTGTTTPTKKRKSTTRAATTTIPTIETNDIPASTTPSTNSSHSPSDETRDTSSSTPFEFDRDEDEDADGCHTPTRRKRVVDEFPDEHIPVAIKPSRMTPKKQALEELNQLIEETAAEMSEDAVGEGYSPPRRTWTRETPATDQSHRKSTTVRATTTTTTNNFSSSITHSPFSNRIMVAREVKFATPPPASLHGAVDYTFTRTLRLANSAFAFADPNAPPQTAAGPTKTSSITLTTAPSLNSNAPQRTISTFARMAQEAKQDAASTSTTSSSPSATTTALPSSFKQLF